MKSCSRIWFCALLVVTVTACRQRSEVSAPPVAVTVVKVSETEQSLARAYTAYFEPYQQVPIGFQASGYVSMIRQVRGADGRMRPIQAGDQVVSQEVLATINDDSYEMDVDQLAYALAGYQAAFTQASRMLQRDSQLMKFHVIAASDYDQASEEYYSTRAQVEQARAKLKDARINLDHCELKSPISGVILERHLEVGSLAQRGATSFVVADTSAMKAIFGVSDVQVEELKLGQQHVLTIEALPGLQLVGKITKISPSADPTTRVFDVEETVPNTDRRLRTGMIASLILAQPNAQRTIALPLNAIVRPPQDRNEFGVYVIKQRGNQTFAKLRRVRLGEIVGNEIRVLSGVTIGDRVIVRGATIVYDGARVTIIP